MRYWCWRDPRGVGEQVAREADKRGHLSVSELFDADVAFVRTVNYPPGKAGCLDVLNMLKVSGVPSVPHWHYSNLYDNKAEQLDVLRRWMPRTHYIRRPDAVPEMSYPFVSKSAHGSGSKCVRLVRNAEEANAEVDAAFGQSGIMTPRGPQRRYLLWQDLVPDNKDDVRVCVCGGLMYGLVRGVRKDVPFASGSGLVTPVRVLDARTETAFRFCSDIASTLGMRWACFDVVFDQGRPLVLEVSFSWTEDSYLACQSFDRETMLPTVPTPSSWTSIVVDEMERSAKK